MSEKLKKFQVIFFYIALFLFIFAIGLYSASADNDLWARLIVGQTFFETGQVSQYDFLSYSTTHRWVDHEWGSSVVFYFIQKHFGDVGLILLNALLNFLVFVLLIEVIKVRHKGEKPLELNFLFFFFAMLSIVPLVFSIVRCQMFTFFFFALWLYVLERVRKGGEDRLLWILPATMVIWANLHGGCFAGLGLLVLYIVGEALSGRNPLKYILALLASFAAIAINPYGLEYYNFLFMATTMKRSLIIEWRGLFEPVHKFSYIIFKAYMFAFCALLFFGLLWKRIKFKDITKTLILLTMFALSVKAIRFQPFLAYSIVAFMYEDFYAVYSKKMSEKLWYIKEFTLYFLVVIYTFIAIHTQKVSVKVPSDKYPVFEVDFIKKNNLKGNVFCNFHHGSYVAYKLYPNNHIIMDGRYEEVYYDSLLKLLFNVHVLSPNWKEQLGKYSTDIIILDKQYPELYKVFTESSQGYSLAMESFQFALFIPTKLLNEHKKLRKQFEIPNPSEKYYTDTNFEKNPDFTWTK